MKRLEEGGKMHGTAMAQPPRFPWGGLGRTFHKGGGGSIAENNLETRKKV